MLYSLFRFLSVLILFVTNIMPESVVVLKKENQALKAQVESLSQAMQKLQEKFDQMQPIPSAGLVNADSSTIRENTKGLEFLSKGYDELILFQAKATAELKQARSRLDELIVKIDAIGQAVDEIEEDSYKFNLKVVGLPEMKRVPYVSSFFERWELKSLFMTSTWHIAFQQGKRMVAQNQLFANSLDDWHEIW